jgi:hypothetical protein
MARLKFRLNKVLIMMNLISFGLDLIFWVINIWQLRE